MATVWPSRVVEEGNLNVQISKLRQILDQDRREGSCIQTVTGFGYRFTADVTRLAAPAPLEMAIPSEDTAEEQGATARPKDCGEPAAAAELCSLQSSATGHRRYGLGGGLLASLIGGLGLLVLLIAATGWRSLQPANSKPPPLSIVVLPFANLGGDREQQYFTDGVTDDFTTDLSRIGEMFVISHKTALSYRDRLVDTRQLGRELGVRYVLEWSVQRWGHEIRINPN
jgi:hypothetical protein